MNKLYLTIYTLIILSACNQQKSSTVQSVDTTLQTTDTISSGKTMTFALRTGIEVIGWIMNISVLCENIWMTITVGKYAMQI